MASNLQNHLLPSHQAVFHDLRACFLRRVKTAKTMPFLQRSPPFISILVQHSLGVGLNLATDIYGGSILFCSFSIFGWTSLALCWPSLWNIIKKLFLYPLTHTVLDVANMELTNDSDKIRPDKCFPRARIDHWTMSQIRQFQLLCRRRRDRNRYFCSAGEQQRNISGCFWGRVGGGLKEPHITRKDCCRSYNCFIFLPR